MKVSFILVSALFLMSCGSQKAQNLNESAGVSIIGGQKLKEGEALSSTVVAVYDEKERFLCTGTLIAENMVLTAAHCVIGKPTQMKIIFGTDAFMTLNAREVDIQKEFVRRVVAGKVHEKYETDFEKQSEIDQNDIALLKFDGALPEGYKIAPRVQKPEELAKDVEATVAGYGVRKVDVNEIDITGMSEKKLQEALESGSIACDESMKICFEVEMTGDGELYSAVAKIKAHTESEVRLDESQGQGTCSGDSGGPAFILKDGQYHIFGVTSRGNLLCDFEGVYTNVVAHSAWIDEKLNELK